MKKLTCVTAVYNAIKAGNENVLRRCISSVEKLTCEHEHLIYDGKSTDGTYELLCQLASGTPGLKIVSEKDSGIYNALNKGVRDAKGEWLYVLGCDDYIAKPDVLDKILKKPWRGIQVLATPVMIDYDGKLGPGVWRRRHILTGMPYCHQGALMRIDSIRGFGGFDEKFKIAADYQLVLKYHLNARPISFVSDWFGAISLGGMSTNGTVADFTASHALAELLCLNDAEWKLFLEKKFLPWHKTFALCFHKDTTVRLGALYMILRRVVRSIKWG